MILFIIVTGLFDPVIGANQLPDTVRIGFLITDKNTKAALDGAEIAIKKANREGGFKGKPFKLVIRTMEGPWGTGSKQAVNLIFDENVWAIVGSHDGRNSHLVEQVTTKARIVFINVWSSDPTLSQAFVPWFFSTVPNDLQQADAFIEEVFNKKNISKTAIICDKSYDSNLAVESLVKRINEAGKTTPLVIKYDNPDADINQIIEKIGKTKPESVIFFGAPGTSSRIIHSLYSANKNILIYGALSLLDENYITTQEQKYFEGVNFITSGIGSGSDLFRKEYQQQFGETPGMAASFSYDGMNCLIKAIRISGLDRVEIQKSLAKIQVEGVTGVIQFDDKGKRTGSPVFMQMKNGNLVKPDR